MIIFHKLVFEEHNDFIIIFIDMYNTKCLILVA
jgi:hypothetical protein